VPFHSRPSNLDALRCACRTVESFGKLLGIKTVAKKTQGLHFAGGSQLDFFISNGLRRSHNVVHVGCGRLRSGVHLIRFLETGCYCGMDKDRGALRDGMTRELGRALFEAKRPLFILTDRFAFECCDNPPEFALADSLFTRLDPNSISLCLQNLRARIARGGIFLAAFAEAPPASFGPDGADGRKHFTYTRAHMEILGMRSGWIPTYIGEWGDPRGLMMMSYRPKPALYDH
jgi:hypothetical protein